MFCNGCSARIQSLRVGQGSDFPVTANHYLYRVQLCKGALQLSLGTFRREPATRRFDESFAPTRRSAERFARQYPFGPPPGFPPASPCPRVGHRLSGLRMTARTPDCAPAKAVDKPQPREGYQEGRAAGGATRMRGGRAVARVAFAARFGDWNTLPLAVMRSSLVRVSRRDLRPRMTACC